MIFCQAHPLPLPFFYCPSPSSPFALSPSLLFLYNTFILPTISHSYVWSGRLTVVVEAYSICCKSKSNTSNYSLTSFTFSSFLLLPSSHSSLHSVLPFCDIFIFMLPPFFSPFIIIISPLFSQLFIIVTSFPFLSLILPPFSLFSSYSSVFPLFLRHFDPRSRIHLVVYPSLILTSPPFPLILLSSSFSSSSSSLPSSSSSTPAHLVSA